MRSTDKSRFELARRDVHATGEQGVQLLYRSWVATGLAAEPFAAWITVWSPSDTVAYELRLGGIEMSRKALAGQPEGAAHRVDMRDAQRMLQQRSVQRPGPARLPGQGTEDVLRRLPGSDRRAHPIDLGLLISPCIDIDFTKRSIAEGATKGARPAKAKNIRQPSA